MVGVRHDHQLNSLFVAPPYYLHKIGSASAIEVETDEEAAEDAWEYSEKDVDDLPAQEVRRRNCCDAPILEA